MVHQEFINGCSLTCCAVVATSAGLMLAAASIGIAELPGGFSLGACCQKVAMLQSYPRGEESIRSLKLCEFIAHRDSSNRTNVI